MWEFLLFNGQVNWRNRPCMKRHQAGEISACLIVDMPTLNTGSRAGTSNFQSQNCWILILESFRLLFGLIYLSKIIILLLTFRENFWKQVIDSSKIFSLVSNINNKSLLFFPLKYKQISITYILFNETFFKIIFI